VRTQFGARLTGASAMLGRTRAVDAACASSSRPSRYSRAVVPSKTAAIEYQRPGSSAPPPRSTDRGPRRTTAFHHQFDTPPRPALRVAQRGDDRFAWLNALDAQPARHRPRRALAQRGRVVGQRARQANPALEEGSVVRTEIRGRGIASTTGAASSGAAPPTRLPRPRAPASDRGRNCCACAAPVRSHDRFVR